MTGKNMTIKDFCKNIDLEKLKSNLEKEKVQEPQVLIPEKKLYTKEIEHFTFKDYSYPFDECSEKMEKKSHIIPDFEKLIFVKEPGIFKKAGIDKLMKKLSGIFFSSYTYGVSVREQPRKICIATYTGEDTLSFTRILYIFDSVEDTIKCLTQEIQKYDDKCKQNEQEDQKRHDMMLNCLKNHGRDGRIIPHLTRREKQILAVLANSYYGRGLPEELYDRLIPLFGSNRISLYETAGSHPHYTFADLVRTAYSNPN